jgi:hypothetical protein
MRTIRGTGALVALAVMLATEAASMQDKPFVRVTEEQAKAALKVAGDAAKGNYASLESNFQKEIRKIWNDYDNKAQPVYERAEMVVQVMGPVEQMVSAATQSLRRGESIDNPSWAGGVMVYVSPLSNESPNITEIVVEREGKVVEPLRKSLLPRVLQTQLGGRQGQPREVHEGGVLYPIAAFDPGAQVVVTAVSDSGRKYSRTIFDRDLRKLQ